MQDRKIDTDVKNRLLDSVGEGKGGMICENTIETCMYITICKTDDQCKFKAWSRAPKAGVLEQPRGMGWEERWEGYSRQGVTCIPVADSCWCMAKSITIL